jgi:hypothetical protein
MLLQVDVEQRPMRDDHAAPGGDDERARWIMRHVEAGTPMLERQSAFARGVGDCQGTVRVERDARAVGQRDGADLAYPAGDFGRVGPAWPKGAEPLQADARKHQQGEGGNNGDRHTEPRPGIGL